MKSSVNMYIDFQKAFNKVPHEALLIKLERLGIQGKTGFYKELGYLVENSAGKGIVGFCKEASCWVLEKDRSKVLRKIGLINKLNYGVKKSSLVVEKSNGKVVT